jgi:hypothetical protein
MAKLERRLPNETVLCALEWDGEALVPDDLWAAIEPLLPPERPTSKGSRPRLSDRAALTSPGSRIHLSPGIVHT